MLSQVRTYNFKFLDNTVFSSKQILPYNIDYFPQINLNVGTTFLYTRGYKKMITEENMNNCVIHRGFVIQPASGIVYPIYMTVSSCAEVNKFGIYLYRKGILDLLRNQIQLLKSFNIPYILNNSKFVKETLLQIVTMIVNTESSEVGDELNYIEESRPDMSLINSDNTEYIPDKFDNKQYWSSMLKNVKNDASNEYKRFIHQFVVDRPMNVANDLVNNIVPIYTRNKDVRYRSMDAELYFMPVFPEEYEEYKYDIVSHACMQSGAMTKDTLRKLYPSNVRRIPYKDVDHTDKFHVTEYTSTILMLLQVIREIPIDEFELTYTLPIGKNNIEQLNQFKFNRIGRVYGKVENQLDMSIKLARALSFWDNGNDIESITITRYASDDVLLNIRTRNGDMKIFHLDLMIAAILSQSIHYI